MKVLINSIGSIGDVNPFLCLGMALEQRGHEVKLLGSGALKDHIQSSGLPFVEVLSKAHYDKWRTMPPELDRGMEDIKAFSYMSLPSAHPSATAILDESDQGCVVIGMPYQSIGVQFAKAKNPKKIHTIAAELAPRSWVLDPRYTTAFNGIFAPYLIATCRQLDLSIDVDNWVKWLSIFDQKLAFYPHWFTHLSNSILTTTRPSNFLFYEKDDEAQLPDELTEFIDGGPPPIAITFGSFVSTHDHLFKIVIDVCQQLGVRAIILTQYAKQLPNPLPSHVFHANYVSLKRLLPKLRLFVHHGGIGTLAQALRAGIPHLTCPMAFDQFDNAGTLEVLNVSKTIGMNRITPSSFYEVLDELISDSTYSHNAKALAEHRFNDDGMETLCEQIERIYF